MDRFIDVISQKRANAYKLNAADTSADILNRYLENIKIGECFYPLLNFLEISLRNRINDVFVYDFGEEWIIDNDFFDGETKETIDKTRDKLLDRGKSPTNYRLVAELNFGFWSNLFTKKYHVIWQQEQRVKRVFVNSKLSIKEIQSDLEIIRKFRNRVFHFETIYTHNPNRCYGLIMKYLSALSPCDDFIQVINTFDNLRVLLKIK